MRDAPGSQCYLRPAQLAPAAAPGSEDPGPGDGDRAAEEGARCSGCARRAPDRIPERLRFRARFPIPLLRPGDGRRQDAPDGRLHQLPAPRPWHRQLLRHGPEPDDLQQAHRRFHPRLAQVRLQRHRRLRHPAAGDHHRRQLPVSGRHPLRPVDPLQDQHLQHLEDQHRGARWGCSPDQASLRIPGRELFRLPRRAAGSRPADGRVAPLPRPGGDAGDQRAKADPGAGADRDPLRHLRHPDGALQERRAGLPPAPGDGGRLRQRAGRRHPQELQPRRDVGERA